MSLDFLLVSLVVIVSPGTGVLYTLAAAIARGSRAGVVAAFGCTLGIVPHMLAAVVGLAAVIQASALAFQTVKFLGVGYLLYLAWSTLRQHGALKLEKDSAPRSALRVIVAAIVVNLLNPKLSVFFFAFLPQFVRPGEPNPIGHMLLLSGVFMLLTFLVFALYGLLAAMAREHILARARVVTWMRRLFAGAFVALAARLALVSR